MNEAVTPGGLFFGLADYAIIALILVSIIIGLFRGFVRESLSIMTWVGAGLVGIFFCNPLANLLTEKITTPSLRIVVAFGLLFVVTLILGSIVSYLISKMVKSSGLSGTDRVIGFLFGLVRGVVVIAMLVMFAHYTHLPELPIWQHSILIPQFQAMADWMQHLVPQLVHLVSGN